MPRAIVHDRYGSPDVLELREMEKPTIEGHQVLVRVKAAAVNPLDWHLIRGHPYVARVGNGLRRPKRTIPGADFAGVVEAVGSGVSQFRAGDEVYGESLKTFADYVAVSEKGLAPKPSNLSFEQAAAVPVAAFTALQGLRDKGSIRQGHRVLINGASGGVGTFAVQIAKSYGAEVTGVCSGVNAEMVKSIGADAVIDYTKEDFTRSDARYDLILDAVGNRSVSAQRRALSPKGSLVVAGAPEGNWIGPFRGMIAAAVMGPFVSQSLPPFFLAKRSQEDLIQLTTLIEAGEVTPVIDRTYPLIQAPEAVRYVEGRHARGKVVITVS